MDNIDISNIKEGDCFKNYKSLCNALNQPTYGGKQKMNQLEDFERYFEFEKIGTKYYITNIYATPIPKEYKYPVNAIYIQYIECILLQYLKTKPNYEVYISSQYLWLELGMINGNYIMMQNGDKKEELLKLSSEMTMFQVNNFYKRSRLKFNKIVDSTLDSLRKRRIIDYDKVYMIRYPDSYNLSPASSVERSYILDIEKGILDELGYKKIGEVFLHNQAEYFYIQRNIRANEMFGASDIFDYFHIIHIQNNTIKELSKTKLQLQKLLLNNEIIKFLNNQAIKEYELNNENGEKTLERFIEKDKNNKKQVFYLHDGYVDQQYLLTDTLIKIKQNNNGCLN